MSKKSSKLYVGMDVHKDSIDLAIGEATGEVRHYGCIGGDRAALDRVVRKLESLGHPLVFVYEAGPVRVRHPDLPGFSYTDNLRKWLPPLGEGVHEEEPFHRGTNGRDPARG